MERQITQPEPAEKDTGPRSSGERSVGKAGCCAADAVAVGVCKRRACARAGSAHAMVGTMPTPLRSRGGTVMEDMVANGTAGSKVLAVE